MAEQIDSLWQLQIRNAELKMENEMLKKAATYVGHEVHTKDESGSLEIAIQAGVANHLKVLWSKVMVLSVKEKAVSKLPSAC